VLAHVLAHEITHVLQGAARHSESGITKARWTLDDLAEMRVLPLRFTVEDVELIHRGPEGQPETSLAAMSPTIAEGPLEGR
jgi:hypothetical protein